MGSGGVAALAECLQAHSVLYGLVRVKDNMGAYEKEKFCCVRWAPEAVPVTPRAKIGAVSMRVSKSLMFDELMTTDGNDDGGDGCGVVVGGGNTKNS